MKVALVYDRVNKIGGAERILTALHRLYPEAPLYTLVHDQKRAPWARMFQVNTSFLQVIPFARTYHEFFPLIPVFAFEGFDFSQFDLVISVTAGEAKGIITNPQTLHISYILTPTRYLWSHYGTYFSNSILRFLSFPVVTFLRLWDQIAAQRPDVLATISYTSQARIKKYYNRDAEVVYPPIDTEKWSNSNKRVQIGDKNYFLVVSRLVKYKRVDIAIEACNMLRLPLKIVGVGMERKNLENLSGSTIEFLGNLTDSELSDYYRNCRALLVPQEEDFGLVTLEAMSFGIPVVAYAEGGAAEVVVPGKNGELFYKQNKEALIKILENFDENSYSQDFCKRTAKRFDAQTFMKIFGSFVEKTWEKYKKGNT